MATLASATGYSLLGDFLLADRDHLFPSSSHNTKDAGVGRCDRPCLPARTPCQQNPRSRAASRRRAPSPEPRGFPPFNGSAGHFARAKRPRASFPCLPTKGAQRARPTLGYWPRSFMKLLWRRQTQRGEELLGPKGRGEIGTDLHYLRFMIEGGVADTWGEFGWAGFVLANLVHTFERSVAQNAQTNPRHEKGQNLGSRPTPRGVEEKASRGQSRTAGATRPPPTVEVPRQNALAARYLQASPAPLSTGVRMQRRSESGRTVSEHLRIRAATEGPAARCAT